MNTKSRPDTHGEASTLFKPRDDRYPTCFQCDGSGVLKGKECPGCARPRTNGAGDEHGGR